MARRQAQTPEQRRRNAKFVKEQEARRGKSEADVKKLTREVQKSPISPVWLGMSSPLLLVCWAAFQQGYLLLKAVLTVPALLRSPRLYCLWWSHL